MRLADFIVSNVESILMEWEVFARSITPGAKMDVLALRDHARAILLATVEDMKSAQTASERDAKSRGRGDDNASTSPKDAGDDLNDASVLHAIGRLTSGFDLMELVSEYRALRAGVLKLWRNSTPKADVRDIDDVTRFNESIDQSLATSVSSYTQRVDQARDLFLAILGHDLRNPLNSITMSAEMLGRADIKQLANEAIACSAQINNSAQAMARMISDLLDYTRTRLGAGMPVSPAPMDLNTLCTELFEEFRNAHPTRLIRYQHKLPVVAQPGEWDIDRLRQALSNLLGNAIQHGDADAPIDLLLTGTKSDVTLTVHNGGTPILPGELGRIFEPLIRGASSGRPKRNRPGSIGLGLHIAREVARSHGGTIDVTSTAESGTAFTVHLPRHTNFKSDPPVLNTENVEHM